MQLVEVAAPDVNHVFSPTGTIQVDTDLTDAIYGDGFVQSRYFKGNEGSPASNRYCYEYRIDLTQVVTRDRSPYVWAFEVEFGPWVNLDFDGDGRDDDGFVISQGGLGVVGPYNVEQNGNSVKFVFDPPIYPGTPEEAGQSSYFFGLVADRPSREATGQVTDVSAQSHQVRILVPDF
jgi:hypothetical protein